MNRADAIELDEQKHMSGCKKCLGKNIDLLEYKAHKGEKALETLESKEFLMREGVFLLEVLKQVDFEDQTRKVAEQKLFEIVNRM